MSTIRSGPQSFRCAGDSGPLRVAGEVRNQLEWGLGCQWIGKLAGTHGIVQEPHQGDPVLTG